MTTRSALVADLKNWSARDDLSDSVIESVLRVAHSVIDRDLRLPVQQEFATLEVRSSVGEPLPEGHLETRAVWLPDYDVQTFPRETVSVFLKKLYTPSEASRAQPVAWTERGQNIVIRPTPTPAENEAGTVVAIEYFKRFDRLNEPDDTNWLLENAYDVYLMACLAALGMYLDDAEMQQKYGNEFGVATGQVQKFTKLRQIPSNMVHNTPQPSVIGG